MEKVLSRHADFEQYVLDEAIYVINDYIFKKNKENGLWTPDMAKPVHRIFNGKPRSYYNYMAKDGLHLSQELKEEWARKILKSSEKY